MKYLYLPIKHTYLKWITLTPILLLAYTFGYSQTFSEGKIVYSIAVTEPGSLPPQAVNRIEKGKLVFTFKNHLFRSDLDIGTTQHINIKDEKNHSGLSLIKGEGGKNFLIRMDQKDLQKEAEKYKSLHFTLEDKTKTIAGYNTHKAIGKLINGSQFVVYYSNDLKPAIANFDPRFKGLAGIPLEYQFNIHRADAVLTITATEVHKGFQPSALFKTPTSGYRELTYNQLQKLRAGKRK